MGRSSPGRAFSAVLLLALAGCGGGASQGMDGGGFDFTWVTDAATGPDLAIPFRAPEDHPQLTQISYNSGRILRNIQLITVGWPGDPLLADRARFAAWMVDSPYWDQLVEYGAKRGTAAGPYLLDTPAPQNLDDAQVGPLLRAAIANGTLPTPEADALYMVYLPEGTTSSAGFGQGCTDYGGYHWWAGSGLSSPGHMAYAIIPDCVPGPGEFDSDTVVASHEAGEAASDPEGGGWYAPFLPQSEIGDLCTPLDATITVPGAAPDGGTDDGGGSGSDGGTDSVDYLVSRLWSAKIAATGSSDPCLPAPPTPPYDWFGAAVDQDGIVVLVGSSTTFQVQPFAYGQVGKINWRVMAYGTTGVTIAPMFGSGAAGSTEIVTVKASMLAQPTLVPLVIEADDAKGYSTVWTTSLTVQ